MKSLQTRVFASLVALLFIVAATASFAPVVDAQRGGGSRMGGSSFRSSSSWSSGPSKSVWGSRSGGGIYTKPSSPSSAKPSNAYGKPSTQPGASSPYSKPSLGGGVPGAYSKPSAVAGKQSSDSYTKPKGGTPGSATTSTFKGGSQFDRKMVQQVKQEKAKASLDSYRAETGKFQKPAGSTGVPLGSLTNRVQFTKKFTITEGSIMEPIMAAVIHFIVAWDLDRPDLLTGWHLLTAFGTRCSGS